MNEELKTAIEGYSEEKLILSTKLGNLPTNNSTIATRSSIERRLKQIDKNIDILLNGNIKLRDNFQDQFLPKIN